MGRARKDRAIIGRIVRAYPEARKKDGKVLYFYLRFVDQTGQRHPGGRINTTSLNEARRHCREWLARHREGGLFVKGTRDALDRFLSNHDNDSTRGMYEERISDLCSHMRWTDVREWTFHDYSEYLRARQKGRGKTKSGRKRKPWCAQTIKTRRVSIQTWLTWLYVHDITEFDIGKDSKGKRFKGPPVGDKPVRWIHKEDYRSLIEVIRDPDEHLPAVITERGRNVRFGTTKACRQMLHRLEPAVVLASAGLRLHEIQVLRSNKIDRRQRRVETGTPKTYTFRYVPLFPDLEEVLERHGVFDRARRSFVMDARFRDRSENRTNYDTALLRKASEGAGIFDNEEQPVTWHTLRRSAGVWLAQAGKNEKDIGKALGHAPNSPMPRRYMASVSDRDLFAAWEDSRGQDA